MDFERRCCVLSTLAAAKGEPRLRREHHGLPSTLLGTSLRIKKTLSLSKGCPWMSAQQSWARSRPQFLILGGNAKKGFCSGDVHASPKSFHVSATQDYPAKLEHESIRAKKDVRQGGKAPACLSVDNPTLPLFNRV